MFFRKTEYSSQKAYLNRNGSLMPNNVSQVETDADTRTSNPQVDFDHGGSGSRTTGAVVGDTDSAKSSAQMASTADQTPSVARSNGHGERTAQSDPISSQASRSGRSNSVQEGLRQVPEGGHSPVRRPVEASISDLDISLNTFEEPSSYEYEPQGELLQERRDQPPLRGEFTIPRPVGRSDSTSALYTDELDQSGGSAVPRRPSGHTVAVAGAKRKSPSDLPAEASISANKRTMRTMSESGDEVMSPPGGPTPAESVPSQSGPATRSRSGADTPDLRPRTQAVAFESMRPPLSIGGPGEGARRSVTDPNQSMPLPARKVFPIQIGDKLFRLSGASISSDAPSYFSQFFAEQLRQNEGADNVRTLYIDRDPATFEDIALHLQGYHVEPRDGPHFVKLFADAQFFSLPRLTAQLFASTIYIRIGDSEFQIPRDLFNNPGDSPNYFSLGFSAFFTTPSDVFPGLAERSLLRPPSILPPSVPGRSAKTFADLLHIIKGYPVEIRSEEHRAELLRDARYYHLKGLEQRLLHHTISYNLARRRTEILLRLEDIRQSGISFVADGSPDAMATAPSPASNTTSSSAPSGPGWVYYQRPYVDAEAYSLIIEITGEENTFLSVEPRGSLPNARMCRATFFKQTRSRMASLCNVIANKMNLPVTQPLGVTMMERDTGVASSPVSASHTGMSEERVKCRIGADADVFVDGRRWTPTSEETEDGEDDRSGRTRSKKRKQHEGDGGDGEEWIVRQAQWRLRVQPMNGGGPGGRSGTGMEVILGAVKMKAFSTERGRNEARGFLSGPSTSGPSRHD